MREEEENDLRQTRGGEYSGSALRGHWNNTRTAYKNNECNEADHTYYRRDGGYGNYNSNGYYTGVGPDADCMAQIYFPLIFTAWFLGTPRSVEVARDSSQTPSCPQYPVLIFVRDIQ